MRILVNAYFAKNLGDDLFLKVLFDRYPKVTWYLLTTNTDYYDVFAAYNNVNVMESLSINFFGFRRIDVFSKINNLFLNYRKYDGLINIGGSIFMETPEWKNGLKSRSLLPAKFKKLSKKSFIIGANFGPFTDHDFVDYHKKYFSLFEDICLRDFNSYGFFKELNNVRVAPDAVFNLKKGNEVVQESCVGFSLMNLENRNGLKSHYQEYNDKMIELVEHYINLGYNIQLFSFCEKEGDLKICNDIKKRIGKKHENKVEVSNYNGDIGNFLSKFQSCELIIGTRFHSIILAFLYNQIVLPIVYSDKTYNVLKDLGVVENCYFINDLKRMEPKNVIFQTNKINISELRSRAGQQFKALDFFITNQ